MDDIRVPIPAGSTRFMDQLRADMRARGYALPTERTYLHWIKRYILFTTIVTRKTWGSTTSSVVHVRHTETYGRTALWQWPTPPGVHYPQSKRPGLCAAYDHSSPRKGQQGSRHVAPAQLNCATEVANPKGTCITSAGYQRWLWRSLYATCART